MSNTSKLPTWNDSSIMTSRAQYAISALLQLDREDTKKPLPLSVIAENDGISVSYLEQLFSSLRKHGIVQSYLGPGGGYSLAKEPKHIRISDIIIAAEDCAPARRARSTSKKASKQSNDNTSSRHATSYLWGHLNTIIYNETSNITLHDIANCNESADG